MRLLRRSWVFRDGTTSSTPALFRHNEEQITKDHSVELLHDTLERELGGYAKPHAGVEGGCHPVLVQTVRSLGTSPFVLLIVVFGSRALRMNR